MYNTLERSTHTTGHHHLCTVKHKPTYACIHVHNTCKRRHAITRTSSDFLTGGCLISGNEIQFQCNFHGDKTLDDSTVCPVCKRIPLFLRFLLVSLYFLHVACFVDCFSSAFCPIYLSVCFLSFSLFFLLPLFLSSSAKSGLSACNRAAIVWSEKQQELYPVNSARSVCVCLFKCMRMFQKGVCQCV